MPDKSVDHLGANPWLVVHQSRPAARMRLFCLPHAGCGASFFHEWATGLPDDIEVCAVQLPGRENRLMESPVTELFQLIQNIIGGIGAACDKSYALFGHSMGALVAFEIARCQQRSCQRMPCQMFLSGRNAPQIIDMQERDSPRHRLSDDALRAELGRMQGTPKKILHNEELMAALLPAVRADLAMVETYTFEEAEPLPCPIHVFGGADDTLTSRAGLESWREQTRGEFQARIYAGDHFFIVSQRQVLLRHIASTLSNRLTRF